MIRTPFHVFLLGTPGSGKSEVFRRLQSRILAGGFAREIVRLDDYPHIRDCFASDDQAESGGRPRLYSRRGERGGWFITNPVLWDHALRLLNDEAQRSRKSGQIVFIEFSRPDMVRSIRENFSAGLRESALLVYVFCPFEKCWERNLRRQASSAAAGGDDHLVSREEMEATLRHDDHDRLFELGIPFVVIDNHVDGSELLPFEIEKVLAAMTRCAPATSHQDAQ